METQNGRMELGGSLPVENVQDLAAKNLNEIPDRYVRPEISVDLIIDDDQEIPVIDLARLVDHQSSNDEIAKLHRACEEWGFFQVSGATPNCSLLCN